MNIRTIIAAGILLAATAHPALAQHQHKLQAATDSAQTQVPAPPGMPSMMSEMAHSMNDPVHLSYMTIRTLPMMKERFDLKPPQVATLVELAASFDRKLAPLKNQTLQATEQLYEMLGADPRDTAAVKRLLREIAGFRADGAALALETAYGMKSELSPEQQHILESMTPMQLHQGMGTETKMMNKKDMMDMMDEMTNGMMMIGDMPSSMKGNSKKMNH